jgi:uncharacterized damage-inducible protein DinB
MLNQALIMEVTHEGSSTRKLLEKVPQDKFDWKPHEKSMSLGKLATHTAEILHYLTNVLTTNELDFSKREYKPALASSSENLMEIFETNYNKAIEALKGTSDEGFREPWTLRNGDHVFFTLPRIAALRTLGISHLIHHRGQLSVYLRLLDIPIPGMYGPSADEM